MMRKTMILFASLLLAGCAAKNTETDTFIPETSVVENNTENPEEAPKNTEHLLITVNDRAFTAELADTDAARAFYDALPMTLSMSELNGNEYYANTELTYPEEASVPSEIMSGDLKLYGNDCIVLFYDSFETVYSYTDLAHIDDAAGLSEALLAGNGEVSFDAN